MQKRLIFMKLHIYLAKMHINLTPFENSRIFSRIKNEREVLIKFKKEIVYMLKNTVKLTRLSIDSFI